METHLQHSANESIHAAHISEVHMVPLNVIVRPILPTIDDLKVESLMKTIKEVCFDRKTGVLFLRLNCEQ